MSESTSKSPKSKKGKKNQEKLYIAGGIVLVVGAYYLYKQHSANTAATSSSTPAAIDPLTGQPYAPGVGSLASGASGSAGIDPLTGQPYQTGVGSLAGLAIDPNTGQTYASEVSALEAQVLGSGTSTSSTSPTPAPSEVSGSPSPVAPTTSPTPSAASRTLEQWTSAAHAQLTNFGVPAPVAAKSLNQYLNGQAITDSKAAIGIKNIVSSGNALGGPPTATGVVPSVRVAKVAPKPVSAPAVKITPQTMAHIKY